jgi:hypothetical protein
MIDTSSSDGLKPVRDGRFWIRRIRNRNPALHGEQRVVHVGLGTSFLDSGQQA